MRPKKIEASKSNLDIVVTIGGADPNRRTIDAAKELLEMRSKIGAITFILGSLASNSIELELYSMQTDIEYKILRAPDNFATHLKDADIILCNGGTTLLESMHIGKPIVVYPQSVAEQSHAEYHAENHACVMSQRLCDVIESKNLRAELTHKAWSTVDGQGSRRLCSSIAGVARQ